MERETGQSFRQSLAEGAHLDAGGLDHAQRLAGPAGDDAEVTRARRALRRRIVLPEQRGGRRLHAAQHELGELVRDGLVVAEAEDVE